MPHLQPTTLWLRPGGHMSHSKSSLPEYLLIGLHLRYSRQVSLITFISQYGFGLVGFRIWLVVRTSRPDGPTTSQGFRPTLLVAGFCSSRSFPDLFRSIRSLPLCPSAPLSHMLPCSLHITGQCLKGSLPLALLASRLQLYDLFVSLYTLMLINTFRLNMRLHSGSTYPYLLRLPISKWLSRSTRARRKKIPSAR